MINSKDLQILPIKKAKTIPAKWYHSKKIFKLENRMIFLKSWHLVGSQGMLKSPGDAVIKEVSNQPIIIIKQNDNSLKAFFNVCQHRGGPLLTKNSCIKALQCKYHGWIYNLNGGLKKVREFENVENFDFEDYNLKPINIKVWQGLLFINFNNRPNNFNSILNEISNRIKPINFSEYTFYRSVSYHIKCNWKTYIDNFLEGYHIPFVHPKLNKVLDYKSYATEIYKNHSLQFAPINSNISPYDKSTGLKNTAYYYTIFPNVLLNIAPGRLQTNVVKPTSPNSCVVDFDYYFDEVSNEVIKNDIKFSNEVQLEDIKICEEVQKRLESRGYNQGRISPQSEKGLYHFQSVLKEKLKND